MIWTNRYQLVSLPNPEKFRDSKKSTYEREMINPTHIFLF
jgi:hypothetical protein